MRFLTKSKLLKVRLHLALRFLTNTRILTPMLHLTLLCDLCGGRLEVFRDLLILNVFVCFQMCLHAVCVFMVCVACVVVISE